MFSATGRGFDSPRLHVLFVSGLTEDSRKFSKPLELRPRLCAVAFFCFGSFRVVSCSFCTGFCAAPRPGGLVEQFIGDVVCVVLATDRDAVAYPLADRVLWKIHRPLLLTGLTQDLPKPIALLYAGPMPDGADLPKHGTLASDRDKALLTLFGRGEAILRQRHQRRGDWDDPLFVAGVVFGLGAADLGRHGRRTFASAA